MNLVESKYTGYALLITATIFAAWGFQHELYFVDIQYSDVAFHLSVLKSLDAAARAGQGILDFWYDGVPYGFALFRAYQYLPHLAMYGIFRLCGEHFTLAQILLGSTAVLATALPASIFFSLRLIGVRALEAGIAALLSVLVSDGSEYGMGLQNYTFATIGITTQLWAMVFLTPAIAACYNYIQHSKNLGLALLFTFLTFGSHVVAAVILMICVATFVAARIFRQRKLTREAFVLFGLILLITAHQWLFVLLDSPYINRSSLEPSWKYQGHGLGALVELLWSGNFFDCNRFPVLTLLLLISTCYLFTYHKKVRTEAGGEFAAYVPFLFVLFFSFCAGRDIWGGVFDLVPVLKSLHVHRFAIAVHLFGIFIISAAVAAFVRRFSKTPAGEAFLLIGLMVFLRPAFIERADMFSGHYRLHSDSAIYIEKDQDLANLLAATTAQPYGWTYVGSKSSWQSDLLVAGYIPIDLFTVMRGIPTVGGILYHAFSLAGETLFDLNPFNPAHFKLFGIRNIIAPASWQGSAEFTLIGKFGRYALWSRASNMLFVADQRFEDVRMQNERSDAVRHFAQTFTKSEDEIGNVIDQKMENAWHFEGSAIMKVSGKVVGAVGYHPNWRVSLDGRAVATEWVLPGFVAVEVPAGTHSISFDYQGSGLKKYLLLLSVMVIAGAFLISRYSGRDGARLSN